jgi:hypothetical protein
MTNAIDTVNANDTQWTDGTDETVSQETVSSERKFTPYQSAKIVNAWLQSDGFKKVLPPQMFYTYTKKNMIENEVVDGKRFVSETSLGEWYNKYVAKNFKTEEVVESE